MDLLARCTVVVMALAASVGLFSTGTPTLVRGAALIAAGLVLAAYNVAAGIVRNGEAHAAGRISAAKHAAAAAAAAVDASGAAAAAGMLTGLFGMPGAPLS